MIGGIIISHGKLAEELLNALKTLGISEEDYKLLHENRFFLSRNSMEYLILKELREIKKKL